MIGSEGAMPTGGLDVNDEPTVNSGRAGRSGRDMGGRCNTIGGGGGEPSGLFILSRPPEPLSALYLMLVYSRPACNDFFKLEPIEYKL